MRIEQFNLLKMNPMSKEKLLGQDTTHLDRIPEAELLHIPKLGGASVTVQLSELDAMRSEHLKAIQVAQKLESEKMKVELFVKAAHLEPEYDQYGRFQRNNTEYTIIQVKHVNLDETVDVLTKKADATVKHLYTSQIKILEKDLEKVTSKLTTVSEERDKLTSEKREVVDKLIGETKLRKEREDTILELEHQVEQLTQLAENKYKPLVTFSEELLREHEELKAKKTFWGWVQKQLSDENKGDSKGTQ